LSWAALLAENKDEQTTTDQNHLAYKERENGFLKDLVIISKIAGWVIPAHRAAEGSLNPFFKSMEEIETV